jgi:hypothetical protein
MDAEVDVAWSGCCHSEVPDLIAAITSTAQNRVRF